MALILNIDTATEKASVSVTLGGVNLAYQYNEHQKEHASFVHSAVDAVLKTAGYALNDLEAFAVTSGPGSYTGLRVGMATAKGFCYALRKPLIAINTLEVMTKAAIDSLGGETNDFFFCPMIDARRKEVFTAIYDSKLEIILAPEPLILEENIFDKYMTNRKMMFFGSGSSKFKEMKPGSNAVFSNVQSNAQHLGILADEAFQEENFADISYLQPDYFKDFHSTAKQ